MPKRTNSYQRLVKLVHILYAPKGATIKESQMVSAPGFGDLREIDVLMETKVGLYEMKFAIEAKDHKRKLSVTDIDSIIGKYRCGGAIIVNEVVLVCPQGYSIAAKNRAKANGIKLVTFAELNSTDSSRSEPKGVLKFVVNPHPAKLSVADSENQIVEQTLLLSGKLICKCCGRNMGTSMEFAKRIIQNRLSKIPQFMSAFNKQLENGTACAKIKMPMAKYRLHNGIQVTALSQLSFHVHATKKEAELEFKTYKFSGDDVDSHTVKYGTARVGNQEFNVLFDSDSKERFTIDLRDCSDD